MSQSRRLNGSGRVDRSRPLAFSFDGQRYSGYHGDTLASALLANGVRLIGRSFKYHRPRGIMTSGADDPNAYVQVGRGGRDTPNQQATVIELTDGLSAESINCWPSPSFDVMAVNGWVSKFLPAGFYYKTFISPGWRFYEWFIRRAAGLGNPPEAPDIDTYDKMNAHCDVLVVGGGPAGLAAALEAGRAGARVILCDMQNAPGGRLLDERMEISGAPALDWAENAEDELRAMADVRVLTRTSAFGFYDHNFIGLLENRLDHETGFAPETPPEPGRARQRLWRVRAKQVVLAAGALERPMIYADNDRPGCMTAGAVRAYVNRYGVSPGERTVVFTNNDDAYRTALDLKAAGAEVAAIVDARRAPDGELVTRAAEAGIEVLKDSVISAVKGGRAVKAVTVTGLDNDGTALLPPGRTIECDVVASSGGWNPAVHLHSHAGGRPVFREKDGVFVPGASAQAERSAGACNGTFALADILKEGREAGRAAAKDAGFRPVRVRAAVKTTEPREGAWRVLWTVPDENPRRPGKHFLDPHGDVTTADIRLAAREGYESIEHAKRYTTQGMGADQGKTGNVPAIAVLSAALGKDMGGTGTTTFRPPFTPVTFGAIAGRDIGAHYDVIRRTPMHTWHEHAGAYWEDVGQWRRPWYYPKPGETMRDAVNRECLAVRNAVGMLDASTLGKIDIQGPDAAEFLNRVYTNAWSKLEIGKCRYGFMLGEDGMIFDDGVTVRLGEHHYLMHTTSGGAARVLAWLEEYAQTEWPELKVYFNSVTEQWAALSLAGPNARALLSEFTDMDLSPEGFPFMSMREGEVGGAPARVFRISFTGESAFEVNVPAHMGLGLWAQFMLAGGKYGINPYGTEAMHVLRAEKGFVIVGQDTDGTVTPGDLGMDWIVSKKKPDFIGKRSLTREDTARDGRKQLVGLLTDDPNEVLPEGGQITADADLKPEPPMAMLGHVTSSYYSAALGHSIALAMIKNGRARHGETVHIPLPGRVISARVTGPVFYDPRGTRAHG
ncbi:MAG: sarcosine oxidase subunit alpha family protein [Rhodospirillales bacterium]